MAGGAKTGQFSWENWPVGNHLRTGWYLLPRPESDIDGPYEVEIVANVYRNLRLGFNILMMEIK